MTKIDTIFHASLRNISLLSVPIRWWAKIPWIKHNRKKWTKNASAEEYRNIKIGDRYRLKNSKYFVGLDEHEDAYFNDRGGEVGKAGHGLKLKIKKNIEFELGTWKSQWIKVRDLPF